ncbi:MAG: PAS domain-containing protein [Salaquimonas sp.]
MRQASSRKLFEYWNRIRDGRVAPKREEIEPSDIRDLLADTFILEVSSTLRTISYRLAGTRLCAAFGRELKGYGFLGHWAEEDCFEVAKLLTRAYRDFQPTIFVMRGYTQSGKQVDYEMIALPLEPMQDGSIRLLGIATPDKDFYWLGTEPLINCSLRSTRHIENLVITNAQMAPLSPSLLPAESGDYGTANLDMPNREAVSTKKIAHLVVHNGGKE